METARQMKDAVEALLPADAAVFVAAVADWRTENSAGEKIKKVAGEGPPALRMVENPDILAGIGHHRQRPWLVVGFAAETQALEENAAAKLKKKGADFIVANDVSLPSPSPQMAQDSGEAAPKSGADEGSGHATPTPDPSPQGGGGTHQTPLPAG